MTEQVILLIFKGRLKTAARLHSQETGLGIHEASILIREAWMELCCI